MKVVLAEKPSVARDIAAILGANNKREGHQEGNGYAVTWAFGHLVTIVEPEDMNAAWARPWSLTQLPMLPVEWKYRVADRAEKQFNCIKDLFLDPATITIICATDAGREGEHIFRLIYSLSGAKKPVQRLWISSLTADAIRAGFANLKPSSEFDNLANAATARAHADWIVGLNFTRAYTCLNNQLCTIGRVQTPTLALIVERQTAIENFKPTPFYEIVVTFEPGFKAIYITPGAQPQTRLQDRAAADAVLTAITPMQSGSVLSVSTEEKKSKAPGLYDLLTLQKQANRRYGYTAQQTLDIAQSLYEEYTLLSYPRTESRYLSTDMIDQLPKILSTVLNSPLTTQEIRDAFVLATITPGNITGDLLRPRLGKSYVDDTKLTDHHAIIPTHRPIPADLPEKQRNIYQLVAIRFLSIFLPPEVRDETTAILSIADHSFRARGIVIKDPGWTVLEPGSPGENEKEKDSPDDSQQLPQLAQGQQVPKRKAELKEGKTTAPKPYDDASLLTAMKNAGQEINDEDLAAYMKQSGLGTAATRAAIIERLLSTAYIERKKKALIPTSKGTALINQVHHDLKDVGLTASWEQRLADMQDGKLTRQSFENDMTAFVSRILPHVISNTAPLPATTNQDNYGPCPQCKQGVVRKTKNGAGCSRWKEGCQFTIWKLVAGKTLTEKHIRELVQSGRTKPITGFTSKASKKFDASLELDAAFKVKFVFDNPPAANGAAAAKRP